MTNSFQSCLITKLISNFSTKIALTALLFSGCTHGPLPHNFENFVLKAPYDGYVRDIPEVGEKYESHSINAYHFYPGCENYQSGRNHFLINDIYGPAIHEPAIITVNSPLLKIECKESISKIAKIYEAKVKVSNKINRLLKDEKNSFTSKIKKWPILKDFIFEKNDNSLPLFENEEVNTEQDLTLIKLEMLELQNSMKDYDQEIFSAERAKKIVDIKEKIGRINCPFACSVVKVFVFEGQWVLKGDPLISVEKISNELP